MIRRILGFIPCIILLPSVPFISMGFGLPEDPLDVEDEVTIDEVVVSAATDSEQHSPVSLGWPSCDAVDPHAPGATPSSDEL